MQSQVTQRLSLTSRNIDTFWTQRLSLISWNIDAFSSRPVSRAKLILISSRDRNPLISSFSKKSRLTSRPLSWTIRECVLLVTDTEDQTLFEDVPFATMTLLSSACFASGLDSRKEGDGIEEGGKFMLEGNGSPPPWSY
jgi:tyrosyl-DNA phosphodiesterase 2